jgi:hypothetical protein
MDYDKLSYAEAKQLIKAAAPGLYGQYKPLIDIGGGALAGASLGALSSLLQEKKKRNLLRRMITGALLGGTAGGVYTTFTDPAWEKSEAADRRGEDFYGAQKDIDVEKHLQKQNPFWNTLGMLTGGSMERTDPQTGKPYQQPISRVQYGQHGLWPGVLPGSGGLMHSYVPHAAMAAAPVGYGLMRQNLRGMGGFTGGNRAQQVFAEMMKNLKGGTAPEQALAGQLQNALDAERAERAAAHGFGPRLDANVAHAWAGPQEARVLLSRGLTEPARAALNTARTHYLDALAREEAAARMAASNIDWGRNNLPEARQAALDAEFEREVARLRGNMERARVGRRAWAPQLNKARNTVNKFSLKNTGTTMAALALLSYLGTRIPMSMIKGERQLLSDARIKQYNQQLRDASRQGGGY